MQIQFFIFWQTVMEIQHYQNWSA